MTTNDPSGRPADTPRRRRFRPVLVALGVVAVVGGAAALWHLLPAACSNAIVEESLAPDGRTKAVIFGRACGSAEASPQVSLLAADAPLPETAGNVFSSERDAEAGRRDVRVSWVTDGHLRIEHDPRLRVAKIDPPRQDLRVEYVPRP